MIIKIYVVVRINQDKAGAGIVYRAEEYGSILEKQGKFYLFDSSKELSYINAIRLALESIKNAYNPYKILLFCDDDGVINDIQSAAGSNYLLEVSKLRKRMSVFGDLTLSADIPVEMIATCSKLANDACISKTSCFETVNQSASKK
jgi:hypothetical protein